MFSKIKPSQIGSAALDGSVNVPTHVFAEAFTTMTPAEFKRRFGVERPDPATDEIVLYCDSGSKDGKRRSMEAARYLARRGYVHVKNYSGAVATEFP